MSLLFLRKYNSKLRKVLFSSVVPKSYKIIKKTIKEITKLDCVELKTCNLKKFINIKVNRKQIGSDRLANAIAVIDSRFNYIIVDFGTATNFDIVIKFTESASKSPQLLTKSSTCVPGAIGYSKFAVA